MSSVSAFPSMQIAVSAITLSHLISKKKAPEWIATRFSPAKTVQINDVIGVMQPDEFHRSMTNSIKLGFKTIKVKCPYPFGRSEEHTSGLQSRGHLVCRPLLERTKW